jgi:hypothetical protein
VQNGAAGWRDQSVAVCDPDEGPVPDRLPGRCLPAPWGHRDRFGAQGSGELFLKIHLKQKDIKYLKKVRVENVPDPENHIQAVLDRVRPEHLSRHFNFVPQPQKQPGVGEAAAAGQGNFWTDAEDFLSKVKAFLKYTVPYPLIETYGIWYCVVWFCENTFHRTIWKTHFMKTMFGKNTFHENNV